MSDALSVLIKIETLEPLDTGDGAIALFDPVNGIGNRFCYRPHMGCIGMKQCVRICHDADMTAPEDHIASLQHAQVLRIGRLLAQRRFLQVGITEAGDAASLQAHL